MFLYRNFRIAHMNLIHSELDSEMVFIDDNLVYLRLHMKYCITLTCYCTYSYPMFRHSKTENIQPHTKRQVEDIS